ncbi:MAG: hypothetical protein MSH25_07970, partial [Desulfovibrio sp.]|uniref:hypothetical protein n=1 Tax=Desulfovibrio sp. TaxID=885 RepID=UPI0025B82201
AAQADNDLLRQSWTAPRALWRVMPEADGNLFQSIFSLKCFAFQTIRPVVSRKKRGFSAHFWPGGAVTPPRVSPFSKLKRSTISMPMSRAGEQKRATPQSYLPNQ